MADAKKTAGQWRAAIRRPTSTIIELLLLAVCFLLGLKVLNTFGIYSAQAAALAGWREFERWGFDAQVGQGVSFAAFVASQLLGGFLLRTLIGFRAGSLGDRIKQVIAPSLVFALTTVVVVAMIFLVYRPHHG